MLSLSPRYDQFRFALPKDFLPEDVTRKYAKILSKNPGVIRTPIDYLNESIQGISIPGLSDLIITQTQHSKNPIQGPHKINVEPKLDINYMSTANPLDKIERTFKVTFRRNQGLFNYFMLYETIFHHFLKAINKPADRVFYVELLDSDGTVISKIKFEDCFIEGIEGLEFSYNKTEREVGTFDVTFHFNNLDFDFVEA